MSLDGYKNIDLADLHEARVRAEERLREEHAEGRLDDTAFQRALEDLARECSQVVARHW